jgi:hypothetical protein
MLMLPFEEHDLLPQQQAELNIQNDNNADTTKPTTEIHVGTAEPSTVITAPVAKRQICAKATNANTRPATYNAGFLPIIHLQG